MITKKHSSPKRDAILASIKSTKTHPNAEWIYTQLKPEFPDLSLGTVYRNIALFKEEGEVISVGVVKGQDRLDGNTAPHPHFVCKNCGAVIDIEAAELEKDLDEQVSKLNNVRADFHDITFYGLCQKCLQKH